MTRKISVLFICQHNSGRSQIAEAYLEQMFGEQLNVESAGFEPAENVNPLVVEVMKEEGLDLSAKKPQSVFELYKQGRIYDHVITVCEEGNEKCPVFPGITKRWHYPFPDPAAVEGSEEAKRDQVRKIRDQIKTWLENPPEDSFNFKNFV